MADLSEAAQVEMMKLAVQLTQQYFSNINPSGHFDKGMLKRAGVNVVDPADISTTTVIDHFYTHLCSQIKP